MARLPGRPAAPVGIVPPSTAALLQSAVSGGLANFGVEKAGALLQFFCANYAFHHLLSRPTGNRDDPDSDGGRWDGDDLASAAREKDIVDRAELLVKVFLDTIRDLPGVLVYRTQKGGDILRALHAANQDVLGGATTGKGKGKQTAGEEDDTSDGYEKDGQEELCIWLAPRFLLVCAILRAAPIPSPPQLERLDRRHELVSSLEVALDRMLHLVLSASHKDLKVGRIDRRRDLAAMWRVLGEETRAWLSNGPELHPDTDRPLPGAIKVLGSDRRTQFSNGGLKSTAAAISAAVSNGAPLAQLDHRPFLVPLLSRSHAKYLLFQVVRSHASCISHSPPYFVDTSASAAEALTTMWSLSWPATRSAMSHTGGPIPGSSKEATEAALRREDKQDTVDVARQILEARPEALTAGTKERVASLVLDQVETSLSRRGGSETEDEDLDILVPGVLTIRRLVAQAPSSSGATEISRHIVSLVARHTDSLVETVRPSTWTGSGFRAKQVVAFLLLTFPRLPRTEAKATWERSAVPPLAYRLSAGPAVEEFERILTDSEAPKTVGMVDDGALDLAEEAEWIKELWIDARSFVVMKPAKYAPASALEGFLSDSQPFATTQLRKRKRGNSLHTAPVGPSSDGFADRSANVHRAGHSDHSATVTRSYESRNPKPGWRSVVDKVISHAPDKASSDDWRLEGLESHMANRIRAFESLAPDVVCASANRLSLLACARGGSLRFDGPEGSPGTCALCDDSQRVVLPTDPERAAARGLGGAPLEALRGLKDFLLSIVPAGVRPADKSAAKAQVAILRLLVRVLTHTRLPSAQIHFDPTNHTGPEDPLITIIFTLMKAENRMVRIVAGRVLAAALVVHTTDTDVNGVSSGHEEAIVDDLAVNLASANSRALETMVITIVDCFSLATSNGGSRLINLVVGQLGRREAYLRSMARSEITALAKRRDLTVYKMLAAHLPAISEMSANYLSSLSNLLPTLAELLGMSTQTFLVTTADYTLPPLVFQNRKDTIQQIAQALDCDFRKVLVDHAGAILSYLFLRPVKSDIEAGTQRYLQLLSSVGGQDTLEQLTLQAEDQIMYRIITEMGDESKSRRTAAKHALKILQRHAHPPKGSRAVVDKGEIGAAVEARMLYILTQVNERLLDMHGKTSTSDKIKNLRGVAALMDMAGPSVSGFTPQIMATLQTSLRHAELRGPALEAWAAFVQSSRWADLGPFIGQISATFVHYWDEMTGDERDIAASILDEITKSLKEFDSRHRWQVADLTGLGLESLDAARQVLEKARSSATLVDRLGHLVDRIVSENEFVSAQGLKELRHLLAAAHFPPAHYPRPSSTSAQGSQMHDLLAGDIFDPIIGRLLKAILSAAMRGSDSAELVRGLAFDCLGQLGAVDPDRCEVPSDAAPMVLAKNFASSDESADFAIHLVVDGLVGAFRSTNDTKHQHYLAYTIQELLRFCRFDQSLLAANQGSGKHSVSPRVKKRWEGLPKSILNTITPLLGSRFSMTGVNERATLLPVYTHNTTFSGWISAWTLHLISQADYKDARTIFGAFIGVIRNSDIGVALKLLPHLALHVVLSDKDGSRSVEVRDEITAVLTDQVNRGSAFSPEGRQLTAQAIFDLMDHFSRWIRDRRKEGDTQVQIKKVEDVMGGINQDLMAKAALECKAHARALLNFEQRIVALRDTNLADKLGIYYEHLHEIYAAIEEPDGMEGISTKIPSPSILHQIREHESTGHWTAAQSCWEVQLQREPDELRSHIGLLSCLRNLGHYDSLRTHILGVLQSHPDWEAELAPFTVETSLVSSDWEALRRAVQVGSIVSPEIVFGRVVSTMLSGEASPDIVRSAMGEARMRLGNQILGGGKDTYQRVYGQVIYLAILHELDCIDIICNRTTPPSLGHAKLLEILDSRFDALSPTFRFREQVLRLRRAAFQLRGPRPADAGRLWVETSKVARKAGHLQTAYSAVLQATRLEAPMALLQRAKLLKLEDQPYKAIAELTYAKSLLRERAAGKSAESVAVRDYGKATLQLLRWMDEVERYDYNTIVSGYKELPTESGESAHYHLGRYLDSVAQAHAAKENKSPDAKVRILKHRLECVKQYVLALQLGTKYIFQTLPRILTTYFETGDDPELILLAQKVRRKSEKSADKKEPGGHFYHDLSAAFRKHEYGLHFYNMDKQVLAAVATLPAFVWLTALPQVVSRVMHKAVLVQAGVARILSRAALAYPDQALWAMVSAFQSADRERGLRCRNAVEDAIRTGTKGEDSRGAKALLNQKYHEALQLVPQLLILCNHPVNDKVNKLSMSRLFPNLVKLAPCSLIIPLQASLTASLPPRDSDIRQHRPFSPNLASFNGFLDDIDIMSSLQKPRKITVWGSDGKQYPFLCKPKDDLRKDARLMEFNSMINKLLRKDSESRRRNLHIRTYAVVVLNEECGLLEWVSNTIPLRNILVARYRARGIEVWGSTLKLAYDRIKAEPSKAGQIFEREILPMYPPVFHEWFLNTFPEPNAWLRGRHLYGRTAAVMSMVGFVLGLGDRHGENILFDSMSGATVHVDFNCLFDKGRTFEVPERVPFRLTHNMVDGLGVTGTEGVFRKACEVTMRILRLNKESLRSVLETFVHDPLVDWLPNAKKKHSNAPAEEHVAREAKRALDPIMRKLTGTQITLAPPDRFATEASTENQVESLIKEATDVKNLAALYVGWSAWC